MKPYPGQHWPNTITQEAISLLTQRYGEAGFISFLNAVQDKQGNTGSELLKNNPQSIIAKFKATDLDPLDDLVEELRRLEYEEKGAEHE